MNEEKGLLLVELMDGVPLEQVVECTACNFKVSKKRNEYFLQKTFCGVRESNLWPRLTRRYIFCSTTTQTTLETFFENLSNWNKIILKTSCLQVSPDLKPMGQAAENHWRPYFCSKEKRGWLSSYTFLNLILPTMLTFSRIIFKGSQYLSKNSIG